MVQLADGGSAFWCEAALRVDVAVWRASPASHLPRAHVAITCVAAPRASRPPARVACLFLAAIYRRPRGGRGRRAGNDAGGGDGARVGAARYVRISARGRRRRGATRGTVSHTTASPRRPSRMTYLTVPSFPHFWGPRVRPGRKQVGPGGTVLGSPPPFCPYEKSTI